MSTISAAGLESLSECKLIELKSKILDRLSDALGECPLPSYDIDGTSFDWNGYIKALERLLDRIDIQLNKVPVEITQVYIDPSLET